MQSVYRRRHASPPVLYYVLFFYGAECSVDATSFGTFIHLKHAILLILLQSRRPKHSDKVELILDLSSFVDCPTEVDPTALYIQTTLSLIESEHLKRNKRGCNVTRLLLYMIRHCAT